MKFCSKCHGHMLHGEEDYECINCGHRVPYAAVSNISEAVLHNGSFGPRASSQIYQKGYQMQGHLNEEAILKVRISHQKYD